MIKEEEKPVIHSETFKTIEFAVSESQLCNLGTLELSWSMCNFVVMLDLNNKFRYKPIGEQGLLDSKLFEEVECVKNMNCFHKKWDSASINIFKKQYPNIYLKYKDNIISK